LQAKAYLGDHALDIFFAKFSKTNNRQNVDLAVHSKVTFSPSSFIALSLLISVDQPTVSKILNTPLAGNGKQCIASYAFIPPVAVPIGNVQ